MQKIHCEIWCVDAGILAAVNQQGNSCSRLSNLRISWRILLQSCLNGSFQSSAVNVVHVHLPSFVEEPVGETQKLTYASILCVAKGQPASSVAPQHSVYETALLASDWNDFSQSIALSNAVERHVAETAASFRPRR